MRVLGKTDNGKACGRVKNEIREKKFFYLGIVSYICP